MIRHSVTFFLLYLLFGLLVSGLMRKTPIEDWDESLLASLLGPPLFLLITALVVGRFVWLNLTQRRA